MGYYDLVEFTGYDNYSQTWGGGQKCELRPEWEDYWYNGADHPYKTPYDPYDGYSAYDNNECWGEDSCGYRLFCNHDDDGAMCEDCDGLLSRFSHCFNDNLPPLGEDDCLRVCG